MGYGSYTYNLAEGCGFGMTLVKKEHDVFHFGLLLSSGQPIIATR